MFNPTTDDLKMEDWTIGVSNLADRYMRDDDTVIRLISSRFRGNARSWYEEQVRYDASNTEIKQCRIHKFRKSIPFSKLLKNAANYATQ